MMMAKQTKTDCADLSRFPSQNRVVNDDPHRNVLPGTQVSTLDESESSPLRTWKWPLLVMSKSVLAVLSRYAWSYRDVVIPMKRGLRAAEDRCKKHVSHRVTGGHAHPQTRMDWHC